MYRSFATVALALAASVAAAPASASHVCVQVEKTGTVGPPLSAGPTCTTMSMHLCDDTEVGLAPTLGVKVSFCVPR